MESSKLPKVGLALTIFAVIFQVIGLASPYWFAQNADLGVIKLKIHAGLWKCCKGTDDNIKCDDIDDCLQEDWIKTVQAMSIMGFIALLVALVMACLYVMKDNKTLEWLAIVAAFAAAFLILSPYQFSRTKSI
uniref:Uncharacterized protein LOC111115737 n=1 Tax=Crassostrea virginica TaxID=6565 RepID=A0A8B8C3M4_CRAVI|nr:uncharacterized protein LOC111115737 [Crassostrea virginica]XP_022310293.1 uncharacterized protein LOC111115737 [Crassostrea virginica]